MSRAVIGKRTLWVGLMAAIVLGLGVALFLISGPAPKTDDSAPITQVAQSQEHEPVPDAPPPEYVKDVTEALEKALKSVADEAFRQWLQDMGDEQLQRMVEADPYISVDRVQEAFAAEHETPEEMVTGLSRWYRFDSPNDSDPLLDEVRTSARVKRLLEIVHNGTDRDRQALFDQMWELTQTYLEELTAETYGGYQVTAGSHPPPQLPFLYVLAELDEDGTILRRVVAMHQHTQQVASEWRVTSGRFSAEYLAQRDPSQWVINLDGAFLAYAAADCLSTYVARPDLQQDLVRTQRKVLKKFQAYLDRRNGKQPDYFLNQIFIMRLATDFVDAQQ